MNEAMTSAAAAKAGTHDWEILRASRPEDFSGATEFNRMNALQRLRWLDIAVDFVARQKASSVRPQVPNK